MATISYNFDQFDESKKLDLALQNRVKTAVTKESQSKETINKLSEDDFSFWDFLDMINPLQHIPVVNTLYQSITGDEIKGSAKIIGGAIFTGFPGLIGGVVDSIVEQTSGKNISGHLLALVSDPNQEDTNSSNSDQTIVLAQQADQKQIQKQSEDKISSNTYEIQNVALSRHEQEVIKIFARQYIDHEGNIILSNREQSKHKEPIQRDF